MDIQICEIDPAYSAYLKSFDERVSTEHPRGTRKFIGIIFEIDDKQYYAPMTSPKPKHSTLSAKAADIYKIDGGNLGIVNLNNMIPVPQHAVIQFNIHDVSDTKYRTLLTDQARIFHRDEAKIKKKAERLYNMVYKDNAPQPLKLRCCDFKLLEEKSLLYPLPGQAAAELL